MPSFLMISARSSRLAEELSIRSTRLFLSRSVGGIGAVSFDGKSGTVVMRAPTWARWPAHGSPTWLAPPGSPAIHEFVSVARCSACAPGETSTCCHSLKT
jgi:hypothetical protein